jgi:hypothetical protein
MTEFVFFHRSTRTLVLTDCIENFEAPQLAAAWMRWLARLGGVLDPDGQTPRDLRGTFWKNRSQVARTVDKLVSWNPERIILAHGRWYPRDGTAELQRALRWTR